MDSANLFETRITALHLRAEFGIGLAAATTLALMHLNEINWIQFVVLFAYIDVFGYLPGVLRHMRRPELPMPHRYYVLYNTMHSFVTTAVVAAIWVVTFGPVWALLALPIHLCGDRALFGNFMKPFAVAFEPEPHPAYVRFISDLDNETAEHAGARQAVSPA